jgi:hypothetical protein
MGKRITQFGYYKSIVALSIDKSNLILSLDRHRNIAFNQIHRSLCFFCFTLSCILLLNLIDGNGPVSAKQQDDIVGVEG